MAENVGLSASFRRTRTLAVFQDRRDVRVNLALFFFVPNDHLARNADDLVQIERVSERNVQRSEQLYEIALGVKGLDHFQTGIDGFAFFIILVVSREVNRGHVLFPEPSLLKAQIFDFRDGHVVQTFVHQTVHFVSDY